MKLWIKIVLLNVGIGISLGTLIGLAIRDVVTKSLRDELTNQGISIARNLSDRIADSLLLNDLYTVQAAVKDVSEKERDVEYIFVSDNDGRPYAHTFVNGYPPDLLRWNPLTNKSRTIQLLETEKGYIRDIGIKVFEGMSPELHIGLKEERIAQTLNRIRNLTVTLTAVVIIIGTILSFYLSKIITKPLYTLVEFTHNLSRGDFGKQIAIGTKDEVGELADTFNNLSQELQLYRERTEESYKQMLRTEKLTALGRLSAGLAHEIRNPLTSIKVLFQTFKDNPVLTKEDMRVVISAADQMDDLLAKFLKFARSDEFVLSNVYINPIIKQVVHLIQFQLKKYAINVDLQLTKLPLIRADRALIQQALLNLVLNAVEAMPDGGVLTLASGVEGDHISITVKDTGRGIPAGIQDKVFDPFFTTREDGTGLGLSIVYNIINLHNGNVGFASDEQGTSFHITLPLGT